MLRLDTKTGEFVDEDEKGPLHKLLYGKGEPPQELGNPGDFYIETESWEIYQKGETWGEGVPLIGPPGKNGESIKGEKGDRGEPGRDGEQGIQGIQGLIGLTGLNGKNGRDGREIELKASDTHFQWRYVGEEWINLAPLPKNLIGGGGRMRLRDLADMLEAGSNITITQNNATKKITIAAPSSTNFFSRTFERPLNQVYVAVLEIPFACTLTSIERVSRSGTIDDAWAIGSTAYTAGTAITGGSGTISSTQGTLTLTANNSVSAGQHIHVTFSSNSLAKDVEITINYTR